MTHPLFVTVAVATAGVSSAPRLDITSEVAR